MSDSRTLFWGLFGAFANSDVNIFKTVFLQHFSSNINLAFIVSMVIGGGGYTGYYCLPIFQVLKITTNYDNIGHLTYIVINHKPILVSSDKRLSRSSRPLGLLFFTSAIGTIRAGFPNSRARLYHMYPRFVLTGYLKHGF